MHQKTGESAEQIAERKRQAAWGAWLDVPFDPAAAAAAAAESEGEEEEGEDGQQLDAAETAAAAAAAMMQLGSRRAQQQQEQQQAGLPEGAGSAVLLYAALRWHVLASRFAAAVQVGGHRILPGGGLTEGQHQLRLCGCSGGGRCWSARRGETT